MAQTIPGTRLRYPQDGTLDISQQFSTLFSVGGLTLSQISAITGLEGYVIQNWIRRGFLLPPVHRQYTLPHLCRVAAINAIKDALPIEQICQILDYSGSDVALFFLFAEKVAGREVVCEKKMETALEILYKAWLAAETIGQANEIFRKTVQTDKDCV